MTARYEVDLSQLDELERKLADLGRNLTDELEPALEEALNYLWQVLPSYPPKPARGEASKHWTPKQRRWFFAALWAKMHPEYQFSGKPLGDLPYKRRQSGGLGGSFSVDVQSNAGEIVGLMGPSIPYAKYVIGEDDQAVLHQGRWWIFEKEVEKHYPEALRIIGDYVEKLLSEL